MTANPYALGMLLEDGDLPRVPRLQSGLAHIAQRVRAVTLTHKGEWPLDTSLGIDWRSYLQSRPFDAEGLAADLAVAWASVPGIVAVLQIDIDTETLGEATITARLQTITGETLTPKVSATTTTGNPSITLGGLLAASATVLP